MAFSEQAAREKGLTPPQYQALLAIRGHAGPESISIGELADSLLIKNHSAIGLVARLVERDLVARRPSVRDGRRVLVELRPRGVKTLESISSQNLAQLTKAGDILSDLLAAMRSLDRMSD
jgi:DNA-binding MarR family transcriptional regulator